MSLTKCDLCKKYSASNGLDTLFFGEWMSKNNITCHYFCLLLSTHLPQRGHDTSGILGFQLCDIRKEITNAKKRECMYCNERSASIMCIKCKQYLHLTCGHTNICLFQFIGEFQSYCHKCIPPDDDQMRSIKEKIRNETELRCYICMVQMGAYNRIRWIYAKCCGNGYAHSKCVKKYALNAGYYLTCIWCKDKQFRNDIKYQGVFVPDRDANWETEMGAYRDLHRSHRRCDMETCRCPKGRHYINSNKWQVITCKLCGAFGAHNPSCIPGFENSTVKLQCFTCDTCSVTEHTLCLNKTTLADGNNGEATHDIINTSLYINKEQRNFTENLHENNIYFSDESEASIVTVKNLKIHNCESTSIKETVTPGCIIPILTQSDTQTSIEIENAVESQDNSKIFEKNVDPNVALVVHEDNLIEQVFEDDIIDSKSDVEETLAVDRLVQRMMDLFE